MIDLLTDSFLAIVLDPGRLSGLLFGVGLGFIAGIVPGIGGRVGLLLALPLAMIFEPLAGAVFLLSFHSVVHTSGSITPIAYGLPTSASEAATAIDGFQLQRKGRGAEALGASLSASSIGGVVGAIVFIAVVPLVRPIVTHLGAPEFLVLALLGLSLVSTLSDRQVAGGVAVGALGLLAATVGLDTLTAVPRFTFGRLELWDGLELVAVIGGLFVVPEMLSLAADTTPPPGGRPATAQFRGMIAGMVEALHYRMVLVRSTIIGIVVGIMPGVGASVAVWIAYADAARRAKTDVPFGSGALAGVIAPEAANNSKEGGALIPTVFFGIPGSSSMAIMLGGFAMLGIEPGPAFLGPELPTAMVFAWAVALGNILTIPLFLFTVPLIVGITAPRPASIVPYALVAAVTATHAANPTLFGLSQFALGGCLGLLLKASGLPRAPFLLGFVMGPIAETSLGKTIAIFGWDALLRPGVIILGVALLLVLFRLRAPASVRGLDDPFSRPTANATFLGMIVLAAAATVAALNYRGSAGVAPIGSAAILGGAALVAIIRLRSKPETPPPPFAFGLGGMLALLVLALPFIGLIPASLVFLVLVRGSIAGGSWRALVLSMIAVGAIQYLMLGELLGQQVAFGVFDQPLFEIFSRLSRR